MSGIRTLLSEQLLCGVTTVLENTRTHRRVKILNIGKDGLTGEWQASYTKEREDGIFMSPLTHFDEDAGLRHGRAQPLYIRV